MECNKEEAFRAKAIAERKMQEKEFVGARKFALKAQQLYPDTENISQMICVCDVHCSAEKKICGNDLDWYGILQIDHTADDTLIKKHYRKFALLLHPDKNKFAGAEAAFKLIGEAQRVLLDKDKRSFFDMKRRTAYKPVIPSQPSQQASKSSNAARQSRAQNNFTSNLSSNAKGFNPSNQGSKQQTQQGFANGKETFWTLCPFCAVRYQYYKDVLDKALKCQSCKKPFIAYDMHASNARPGFDATQPVFPQQDVPNVCARKAGAEAPNVKPAANPGFQAEQNAECNRSPKARQSHKGSVHMEGEQGSKPSRKANGKKGKKHMVESSESFESESSLELDSEGVEMQSNGDNLSARRSSRNKRHVSYNENVSDDEETINGSKRAKVGESSSPQTEKQTDTCGAKHPSNPSVPASAKEGKNGVFNKSDGSETVVESVKKSFEADNGCGLDSSPEKTPVPTFHEYPDPEFTDFDKDRGVHCFKVGQVWAAYDTVDAMPRFYARIRKIFPSGFKVRITWLEPDPDDEDGIEWCNSELPYSCGQFKFGDSENTEDRLMFSHEISFIKGTGRDSFKIYPSKGEIWALFKNWNAKWHLVPENERKFEYEFVEILTEYDETTGIRVAPLGKLKGFVCLFCRKGGDELQIPPAELLRFSHKVPSNKLTGVERKDVPMGSFELDTASITMNLEEITLPKMDGKAHVINLSSDFAEANPAVETAEKATTGHCSNGKDKQVEHVNNLDSDVNALDIPDPEFFNFDTLKSVDKFEVNQVWALYSDVDGTPKYYGVVKKVETQPDLKLHIGWLEPRCLPTDTIYWKDRKMPFSCGQFKVKMGKSQLYTNTSSFSHQIKVQADQNRKKTMFDIYPQKDDVWALYKNWHPDMGMSDLKNCEYDIVEVLEVNALHFKVLVLERVHGFSSVFKPQKEGNSSVIREIPGIELFRFSHQIPSFRLTDEKGGKLRGFWELDPAAFPIHLLYKSK